MIDIIMPVYNAEKYLKTAIKSILNQTYRDFNFYIIDDGSEDKSLKIAKYYAKKDKRLHVYGSIVNRGVTSILNSLLKLCSAKYIGRMDADDESHPTRLEKQVKYLDNNPECVAVGCKILVCDRDLFSIFNNNDWSLLTWCNEQTHEDIEQKLFDPLYAGDFIVSHSAVMYRRKAILRIGGYDLTYKQSQDLDLYLRLIESGGKLANLPDVLLKYRLHEKGVCHKDFESMWHCAQIAVAASRKRSGLPELPYVKANRKNLL